MYSYAFVMVDIDTRFYWISDRTRMRNLVIWDMSTVAFLVDTIKPLPRMVTEIYIPIVFSLHCHYKSLC